jgi:hypothetical protein
MADIYDGENYDARKEVIGLPVILTDSDWLETDVNIYFTGDMLAFIGQPFRGENIFWNNNRNPLSFIMVLILMPHLRQINIVRCLQHLSLSLCKKGKRQ